MWAGAILLEAGLGVAVIAGSAAAALAGAALMLGFAAALIRAPVMPNGWPSAIAPPNGLRRSGSIPSSSRHGTTWAANASLSSIRS